MLKKLCPQFSNITSLECKSCQFAKHRHLCSSPRVNKQATAPFELVQYDVWGPCPVTSKLVLDILLHLLMIILE